MFARFIPLKAIKAQRGFAAIVGVVILLVVALMAAAMAYMTSSGESAAATAGQSAEALFIAQSGAEEATVELGNGEKCGTLSTAAKTVGSGTYTNTAGTTYSILTTLGTGGIAATDTTIPLASVASLAPHGLVSITGGDDIVYGATSTSAAVCSPKNAPCLLGARRGFGGSIPLATATAGTIVTQLQCLVRSTGVVPAPDPATRMVETSYLIPDTAVPAGLPQAMMAYTKNNTGTSGVTGDQVYTREWDPTAGGWGAESVSKGVGSTIQFLRLAMARTKDEALLITQSVNGDIYGQDYTGATNTWQGVNGTAATFAGNIGTGLTPSQVRQRAFDAVYQTQNDTALVVLAQSGSPTPQWATWNNVNGFSASLSSTGMQSGSNPSQMTSARWIELAANPASNSNEVMLMVMQAKDDATASNGRAVRAAQWLGTNTLYSLTGAWTQLNGGGAYTAVGIPTDNNVREAIGVGYEAVSHRAMFVASTSASAQAYYWVNTGQTQSVAPTVLNTTGATIEWLRLAGTRNSNNIMMVIQDSNPRLYSLTWNGSTWSATTAHDNTGTQSVSERNFDFAWETSPKTSDWGWLLWGNASTLSFKRYKSGTWETETTGSSPDTNYVSLKANPVTGRMIAGTFADSANPSTLDGNWTYTRPGGVHNVGSSLWQSPPVNGAANGRLTTQANAATSATTPAGERVEVVVRKAGASIIETQEIFP